MNEHDNKPLDMLMGYAVILPIITAIIYYLGPMIEDGQGAEFLLFLLFITFLGGGSGFVIGVTCTGRWLIVAGITGICLLVVMVGLLVYDVFQPIVIPPYP